MAAAQTQSRLSIVVDGNAALAPYWPRIVSEYLEKIVRSFCDNSREQGNNTIFELGLVLYAANSDHGYYVQFINWTEDVEFFLGCLPCLTLNGDDSNQLVMTEGLVEALLMFLKPTTHKGDKHCITVAVREPIPRKTLVSVPVIREGQFCGTLEARNMDIFEVLQMFNMGNNVIEVEYNLSDGRIGEFTVLLSRSFKETRQVLPENTGEGSSRKRSAESITEASNVTLPNVSAGNLPAAVRPAATTTTIGEQTIEAEKAMRSVAVPNSSPQTHEASSSAHHTSMKVFDDMIAELINANDDDDDDVVLSTKRPRTSIPLAVFTFEDLFQPHQPIPFRHSRNTHGQQQQTMSSKTKVSVGNVREVEEQSEEVLMGTNEQDTSKNKTSISNSSTQMTSSSLAVPTNAPSPQTPSAGIGTTTLVVESRGSMGVHIPIPSSGYCSISSHVLQSSSVAGPQARQGEVHQPSVVISTGAAVRLGINVEPLETQTSAGFASGDSLFSNAPGSTLIQFGASSSAPQQRVNYMKFQPSSSSESPKMLPGTTSSDFSSNHGVGNSSIIQSGSSSPATHQAFHYARTDQFETMGNSSVIQFEPYSSAPQQSFLGISTQFESQNAMGCSSVTQLEPSSSAPHQDFLGDSTQFASYNAMGNSSVIPFEPFSSAPHQTFLGASTDQFASHHAMGSSTSIQFEESSSAPHQNFPSAGTQIASHHYVPEDSVIQFQPSSSAFPQMFPHDQFVGGPNGWFSALETQQHVPRYQHQRDLVTNFGPSYANTSAVGSSTWGPFEPTMPEIPDFFLPRHSSFVDFNEYVHTWEGSLTGSTYPGGVSFYRAKAFRKTTAPFTLTVQWKTKLWISHYISQRVVKHTKSLMKSEPDSVFFHITEFNNLDLYNLLMSRKVYAKIDLPSQALILSPTENVLFYEGTVFPGDTIFVEPA